MQVIAYCILHYGRPYLRRALEAIAPQVDKIVIIYTSTPSQGHATELTCPDTRDQLKEIADSFGDKVLWIEGSYRHEGEHCEAVMPYTAGFDYLVRFDSDEIYPEGAVAHYIAQAEHTTAKIFRLPFIHFWKTPDTRVNADGQHPDRLIKLNTSEEGGVYLDSDNEKYSILHFGYAQPTEYIIYKMSIHGHKSEWREEWLQDKWLGNDTTDLHPVSRDFWNAVPFNGVGGR